MFELYTYFSVGVTVEVTCIHVCAICLKLLVQAFGVLEVSILTCTFSKDVLWNNASIYIYIYLFFFIFRYIKPDSCLYDFMVFLTWEHNCHRIVAISWEVPYKYVTEIVQGMYKRTNSLRNWVTASQRSCLKQVN